MDWSAVDYCDVFITRGLSFWRHPFTAEDPLVWRDAKFLKIYSDKDKTNLHLACGFQQKNKFGVNYSFNASYCIKYF